MLTIHKTVEGKMVQVNSVEEGCWVNLVYPSEDELKTVSATLGVEPTFLRAALDEEESSRIDTEDGQTLIIMHADAPEDAQRLAEMLRARIPELKNIRIVMVGPVIGAHCGPGTLASAFMGKPRQV